MSETLCFVFTFQPFMVVSISLTYTCSTVVFGTPTISFPVRTRERTQARTQKSIQFPCQMPRGRRISAVSGATVSVLLLLLVYFVQGGGGHFCHHNAAPGRPKSIPPAWSRSDKRHQYSPGSSLTPLSTAFFFFFFFARDKNAGAAGSTFPGTSADRNLVLMFRDMLLQNLSDFAITDTIVV